MIFRREFLGSMLGFLALISGGLLGSRREDEYTRLVVKHGDGVVGPTVEQLKAARAMMESIDVPGPFTLLVSEEHHEDLVRAYRMQADAKVRFESIPILPSYEVIKWQRLT